MDNILKTTIQLEEPFTLKPVCLKATVIQHNEFNIFIPVLIEES